MHGEYFDKLVRLVGPAVDPVRRVTRENWNDLEKALKVTFPEDYKEFFCIYGSGYFASRIRCDLPTDVGSFRLSIENLQTFYDHVNDAYEDIFDEKIKLFPDKGGLIHFAEHDQQRNLLFWKPKKGTFEIVVCGPYDYEIHKMGFSEFFYRLLTGSLRSQILKPYTWPATYNRFDLDGHKV